MTNTTEKKLYLYNGGVTLFGKVVCDHWAAQTMATSEEKARNNLLFRYAKHAGLVRSSQLKLTGTVILSKDSKEGTNGEIH